MPRTKDPNTNTDFTILATKIPTTEAKTFKRLCEASGTVVSRVLGDYIRLCNANEGIIGVLPMETNKTTVIESARILSRSTKTPVMVYTDDTGAYYTEPKACSDPAFIVYPDRTVKEVFTHD